MVVVVVVHRNLTVRRERNEGPRPSSRVGRAKVFTPTVLLMWQFCSWLAVAGTEKEKNPTHNTQKHRQDTLRLLRTTPSSIR